MNLSGNRCRERGVIRNTGGHGDVRGDGGYVRRVRRLGARQPQERFAVTGDADVARVGADRWSAQRRSSTRGVDLLHDGDAEWKTSNLKTCRYRQRVQRLFRAVDAQRSTHCRQT